MIHEIARSHSITFAICRLPIAAKFIKLIYVFVPVVVVSAAAAATVVAVVVVVMFVVFVLS